ncbi:hypothetical protein PENSUB_483 [Penicillium subrubescens]|uniref:Uncharacterized protein n=1 Tax=Penicillium subrubescens TaxID=1316194 RepID=A0A1Q5UN31_9EURO|nr:hypothetical protein PENSUB_483 [Penicillium subrubescens]
MDLWTETVEKIPQSLFKSQSSLYVNPIIPDLLLLSSTSHQALSFHHILYHSLLTTALGKIIPTMQPADDTGCTYYVVVKLDEVLLDVE